MNTRTDIAIDSLIGEKMSVIQMVEHGTEAPAVVGMICRPATVVAANPASLAVASEDRS